LFSLFRQKKLFSLNW